MSSESNLFKTRWTLQGSRMSMEWGPPSPPQLHRWIKREGGWVSICPVWTILRKPICWRSPKSLKNWRERFNNVGTPSINLKVWSISRINSSKFRLRLWKTSKLEQRKAKKLSLYCRIGLMRKKIMQKKLRKRIETLSTKAKAELKNQKNKAIIAK